MPKQKAIRWAFGTIDGPRSSTWRFWGNPKGDLYSSVRCLGGTFKLSFHKDGNCHFGFTSEYKDKALERFGITNRLQERWRIPQIPVVRLLQILVPQAELRQFEPRRSDSKTIWLSAPPVDSVAVISLVVTPPGDFSLGPSPGNAKIVGSVDAGPRQGRIVYAHNPIDTELGRIFEFERNRLEKTGFSAHGTRAVLLPSRNDHNYHALELACD